MTITELLEKLADPQPGDTFTPSETQQLIDYHVTRAVNDSYNQSRIATAMQEAQRATGIVSDAMQTLINLWQPVTTPQLEVITDESSQGQHA